MGRFRKLGVAVLALAAVVGVTGCPPPRAAITCRIAARGRWRAPRVRGQGRHYIDGEGALTVAIVPIILGGP